MYEKKCKNKFIIASIIFVIILFVSFGCVSASGSEIVGQWNFDGNSLVDSSGLENNGTMTNAQWTSGPTGCGEAVLCDPSNAGSINIGYGVGQALVRAPAITVSAWFKNNTMPSGTETYSLFRTFTNSVVGMEVYIGTDYIKVAGRSVSTDSWVNRTFNYNSVGQWHQIIAIVDYKQKSIDLYLDGAKQTPRESIIPLSFSKNWYERSAPTNSDYIGGSSATTAFDGAIDVVKVYNGANSAEMIGKWNLNEGTSSILNDSSGYRIAGSATNITWVSGIVGNALSLTPASSPNVNFSTSVASRLNGATAITYTSWFKNADLPAAGSSYSLFKTYNGGVVGMEVYIGTDYIKVAGRSDEDDSWINRTFNYSSVGKWHHIAAVVDYAKKDIDLYIDGVEIAPREAIVDLGFSQLSYVLTTPTSNDRLGGSSSSTYFNGIIEDVKIYKGRLSPDNIAEQSKLVADWFLTKGSGTQVLDKSGNGLTGSIINNAPWATDYYGNTLSFDVDENHAVDLGTTIGKAIEGAPGVTIAGWVKNVGVPYTIYGAFSTRINGLYAGAEIFFNPTDIRVGGRSGVADPYKSKTIAFTENGKWRHVAAVFDYAGDKILVYIDGIKQAPESGSDSATFVNSVYTGGTPTANDFLGGFSTTSKPCQGWNGSIDEMKIYRNVLTPTEIAALAASRDAQPGLTNEQTTNALITKMTGAVGLYIGKSDAFVGNLRVKIDSTNFSVTPTYSSGLHRIPGRFLAESFGKTATWNSGTGQLTIINGSTTTIFTNNSNVKYENGIAITMEGTALVSNSTLLVPLTSLCTAIGKQYFLNGSLIVVSNTSNLFNTSTEADLITEMNNHFTSPGTNYTIPPHYTKETRSEMVHVNPGTGIYTGSPSIVKLGANIFGSHDVAGPNQNNTTDVYKSSNSGVSWTKIASVPSLTWATLFEHGGNLYLLGCSEVFGDITIRKSTDGGYTWTTASSSTTGLLYAQGASGAAPNYHTAPVPIVKANGRIYKAYESTDSSDVRYNKALVVSVSDTADLLNAANWTKSNELSFSSSWIPTSWNCVYPSWLEGNMVVGTDGSLYDIIRFNSAPEVDKAVKLNVSANGATISCSGSSAFINFPGGNHKFTIRYDSVSNKYYALTNKNTAPTIMTQRNVLSLITSTDLVNWAVKETVLTDDSLRIWNDSVMRTGYQYVDWQFDGIDIICLVRESNYDTDNYHDANRITFYRLKDFRN